MEEGENKIEDIIRNFKKFTSVYVCRAIQENGMESRKHWILPVFQDAAMESKKHEKYKFWQNEYHPVELSFDKMMQQKMDYVHDNPVKEGIVERQEDYVYSSARDYYGKKGLLEIESF